jgi:ribonuclease D
MPNTVRGQPIVIQDKAALQSLLQVLRKQRAIAVDTESNSLHAYREQVCLIQISTTEDDYLVDTLSLPNLGQLGEIFTDPRIVKVLHGAEYDVLCLGRDFNYKIHNLFDTRVASRTLGWKKSGLGDLLMQVFNVKLDKRFQRANWGKRPLPDDMLDYARLDTHYLLDLYQHLLQELRRANLEQSAREMCEWMSQIPPNENGFDPEDFWRISHARDLSRRGTAILRELYVMRDQLARKHNRPPFKILSDSNLYSIAKHSPESEDQLRSPVGLTKRQTDRFGSAILPAVSRGLKAPIPQKPRGNHRDEAMVARYEALREWRKGVARNRKVDSDIILPREMMETLAREAPLDRQQVRAIMEPLTWRFKQFGNEILNTIKEHTS